MMVPGMSAETSSLQGVLEDLETLFPCNRAFCGRRDNVSITILYFQPNLMISSFASLLGAVYTLIM